MTKTLNIVTIFVRVGDPKPKETAQPKNRKLHDKLLDSMKLLVTLNDHHVKF